MSIWQLLGVTALAGLASASHAGIYYVATDGSAENDGSYARPWPSVVHALDQVGGGNTIVGLSSTPQQEAMGEGI